MFRLKDMKFSVKLGVLIGIALAGLLAFGITSYFVMDKVRVGGPVSNQLTQTLAFDSDLTPPNLSLAPASAAVRRMVSEPDRGKVQGEIAEFRDLAKKLDDSRDHWVKDMPTGEMKDLATVKG